MKVIKIAQVPAPSTTPGSTVLDAVRIMQKHRGGAAAVVDGDRLVGIFSERDVMLRVVASNKSASDTNVADVMTESVETILEDTELGEALELMVTKHIRHLPVVDHQGSLVGLLSVRHLLQQHTEGLKSELDSLEAYIMADGPGG